MKLWRDRIALTSCGTTVSSKPMMPGNSGSPACSFRTRLSRISCLTGRDVQAGSTQVAKGLEWGSHEPILSQPGLHYLAVAPSFLRHAPSAGVRSSRRQRAGAREHDRRLRQRPGARRGRARARRPPVPRRRRRRPSRRAARANDEPRRGRWPIAPPTSSRAPTPAIFFGRFARSRGRDAFPFRGQGIGVPTLGAVLARLSQMSPIVVEMKVNETEFARAVVDVVRQAGAPSIGCASARSAGASCARRGGSNRRLRPAPRARKSAGRSIARGAAGR